LLQVKQPIDYRQLVTGCFFCKLGPFQFGLYKSANTLKLALDRFFELTVN
jgi:hypothetical protein